MRFRSQLLVPVMLTVVGVALAQGCGDDETSNTTGTPSSSSTTTTGPGGTGGTGGTGGASVGGGGGTGGTGGSVNAGVDTCPGDPYSIQVGQTVALSGTTSDKTD